MDLNDYSTPPSLLHRLTQSLCFSCCFHRRRRRRHFPLPSDENPTLIWIECGKSRPPHDHQSLSEIKEACCSIFGIAGVKSRRYSMAEFRYDPLSYALNFEDGFEFDDEAPLKSFSARLPPSPPLAETVTAL
ncbi:uncharacterized protein LOC127263871 [Andrographis paniculata]|uniref:uncharacterized protein LOC127263871 n=1 Tax=Andrographis paniculata TaxID=175694 RepID=UPI0021E7A423|nr:uncharacterized protein LOC127263871 [Andrographis paniculata]